MRRVVFVIVVLMVQILNADVKLSGNQYGVFPSDVYQIEKDIVVAKDNVLTFEKGTLLKFSEFTGVKVYGKFICNGEKGAPIKFTSKTDSTQWNGIEVFENAKIVFGDVVVERSLTGISINDSTNIDEFSDIVLFENDENAIKIGDTEIIVKENKPFTIENVNIYNTTTTLPLSPENRIEGKRSVGLIIARYCLAGAALGGLATWVYNKESAAHYQTKYELDQSGTSENYRIKYDDAINASNVGRAITLVALPLLAVSITIDSQLINKIKNRKKK